MKSKSILGLVVIALVAAFAFGWHEFGSRSSSVSASTPNAKDCMPSSPTDLACPSQDYLDLQARAAKAQADINDLMQSDEVKKLNAEIQEKQITWKGIEVTLNQMTPHDPMGRQYTYDDKTHRFAPPPPIPAPPPAAKPPAKK